MEILYSLPDRIQLKFQVIEESLPDFFTDEYRQNNRNFRYIRQIIREHLGGVEVRLEKIWFRIQGLLFHYKPQDHSFLIELNPLRIAAESLNNRGNYDSQRGLDLNTNFIDPRFLKDIQQENIELLVYQVLEQGKTDAMSIIADFLQKGFKVDPAKLRMVCRFAEIEFPCDIRAEKPSAYIAGLEKPLIANFGDTTEYGTRKLHSITVFKKKKSVGIREHGIETRILYQKSVSIIRYERLYRSMEIDKVNVLNFDAQSLQCFLLPFKQKIIAELMELERQADFTGQENEESCKTALVLWLWKKLSAIKIPPDKFYLIELAVETGQIDTSLVKTEYLKKQLRESDAFIPAMESAGMKHHRYIRINIELFRSDCLAFPA